MIFHRKKSIYKMSFYELSQKQKYDGTFLQIFFTEFNKFLILIRIMDEEPILKDEFSWGCRTVQLKLFTFRKLYMCT